jgi:molybdenum cofactor biosynthesis enzyme MoaA
MTLYIMLAGGCNAHCHFCCWSRRSEPFNKSDYIKNLETTLIKFLPLCDSINILGGEPLISPHLHDVLELIKKLKTTMLVPKVVITTNGSALLNKLDYFSGAVNHVNLSRHAISDADNAIVFGKKAFLPADDVLLAANQLADYDIDLSINCVLHKTTTVKTKKDVLSFVKFCKDNGAVTVCFKKVEGDSLDKDPQQLLFNNTPVIKQTTCDVCRTDLQVINGMLVYWQAALNKSSKIIRDLIIQPNLTVTTDWAGKVKYT